MTQATVTQPLFKQIAKHCPTPLIWLIRPALFLSLGLHLVALLVPLPERSSSELPSVSTLASPQVPVTRLPSPQPTARVSPSPQPSPAASIVPPRPTPAVVRAPQLQPQPRPQVAPVKPPQTVPSPAPTVAASPPSPDPVPPTAIPFGDVPLLAGAESGCYGIGVCHQLADGTPFRSAGQSLEAQFQSQGYSVKRRDDLEDTGRKVYELSQQGETRFLNVLSSNVGTTIYLVTPQPISLQELEAGGQLKAELTTLLDQQVGNRPADPTQIAAPADFYLNAAPRPEIEGELRFLANSTPDQLLTTLTPQLQAQQFGVTAAGGYGGGWLYEITKGAYTGYLNLIPTIDRSGTVVVLWANLPSS